MLSPIILRSRYVRATFALRSRYVRATFALRSETNNKSDREILRSFRYPLLDDLGCGVRDEYHSLNKILLLYTPESQVNPRQFGPKAIKSRSRFYFRFCL
jgi:hypothetical protein